LILAKYDMGWPILNGIWIVVPESLVGLRSGYVGLGYILVLESL